MAKQLLEAQNPLILRCNRLMEAFAKSDDERDFYLDRQEGFIIYANLEKSEEELVVLEKELEKSPERYCPIPKLTFYETKKIMESFVNEKVYDIDTKEKLLDIIQSKEARENFLEFIYDHHSELEKWQAFYQERSRIRIIEWLRTNHFQFVFEEDLEIPKNLIEHLKKELFSTKVSKDVLNARKILATKSKTYYSNEALNPRPKRGRPPKQVQKAEVEHHVSTDIYTTVPNGLRSFLFTPDTDTSGSSSLFSAKFDSDDSLFSTRSTVRDQDLSMGSLDQKLAALRSLSSKWNEAENAKKKPSQPAVAFDDFDEDDDEDDEEEEFKAKPVKAKKAPPAPEKKAATKPQLPAKKSAPKKPVAKPTPKAKAAPAKKAAPPKKVPPKPTKTANKPKPTTKAAAASQKKKPLRPIMKLKRRG